MLWYIYIICYDIYMNERPRKLRWIGGHLFFCKVSASAYADL